MVYKEYSKGSNTGFKGWIENSNGAVVCFIRNDGKVIYEW